MTKRGPHAPHVSTVEELHEIVSAVQAAGAFSFDVETRGNIHRHADVMDLIEAEWQEKLATLKSDHPTTLARSRKAIEDRWTSELALDTLRNEVFWIGIATEGGQSWAIPMGHPNGEVLVKELRGDGSTVPPPGHRAITKSGKESMAKSKFFIPAVFSEAPQQLTQGDVFPILETIFMDPSIVKINQNIKFDAKSVAKYFGGRLPEGQYVDTQVLMHIADENLSNYKFGSIVDRVFQFDPYFRDGKLGATIQWEPFSKACVYVHYDCRWAWLVYKRLWRMISRIPSLYHALHIDLPTIRPVAKMELNGILVNKRELVKLGKDLDVQINELLRDMSQYAPIGFNPDSNPDKAKLLFNKKSEGGLGLKPTKLTDSKNPSVDAESLEDQQGKHPMVDLLIEYAEIKKMKSTYVEGMVPLLHQTGNKHTGRVHPQFHFHRTATGRFSCVSGATLLTTNRGTFRFDEYVPYAGDLVPTHTGAWQPVVRKVFKGYESMVSVHLSNGSVLQCTEQHRVLTPRGWESVGSLTAGSEVYSHVGVKEVYGRPGERQGSSFVVPRGPTEAHDQGGGCPGRNHLPQRTTHREPTRGWGSSPVGEGAALLTVQAGREEPYAGQEWRAAPQLPGINPGWPWVLTEEGEWALHAGAQTRLRSGFGDGESACVAGRASHQREQDRQQSGQPRPGHRLGAREAACEVALITEVAPLGAMGVWDIEVAGDHSYVTHGFLNHNSSDPNLQNIPRDGRMRSLFVADSMDSLVVADYSQIEMRIMAMLSQDPALLHIFDNDIDVHTGTASVILRKAPEDVTGEERQIYGKTPNFLMGYGGGPKRLIAATKGALNLEQAKEVVEGYNTGYAGLTTWKNRVLAKARKQGYVETLGGRRRRLPDLNADPSTQDGWRARSKAERQAINAVVQGTAAEICKEAMVRLDDLLPWPSCKMLVQVHDEMVMSVPTDELSLWVPQIEVAMGNGTILTDGIVDHGVRLVVEAHYAGSWSEAKG